MGVFTAGRGLRYASKSGDQLRNRAARLRRASRDWSGGRHGRDTGSVVHASSVVARRQLPVEGGVKSGVKEEGAA